MPIRSLRATEGTALTADIGLETRLDASQVVPDTGRYRPTLGNGQATDLVELDPAISHCHLVENAFRRLQDCLRVAIRYIRTSLRTRR